MNLLRLIRSQWDRATAVVFVIGGLVALLVGWLAVSGTILTFEQMPYVLSGGILGLCLVALGATLWLSADIRDEWGKLDRLEEALREVGIQEADVRKPLAQETEPPRTGEPSDNDRRPLRVSVES
jgi:hypothetical protein